MITTRISIWLQCIILSAVYICAQGGIRYGPVLQTPTVEFSNVLLKPAPFGIFNKPPVPTYEVEVNDYIPPSEKTVGDEAGYLDHDTESSSNFYGHHHKKHVHKVVHEHIHKGHVIHDHLHDGKAKHLHKHSGEAKHEHHHEGEGHHEHKHAGQGEHKHKHQGHADHGHKHKGEGEHKHEHLGAGKHLHKHSGHSEHGHKHEAKAEHGHKHKGLYDHSHHHKGSGKHKHEHWGDADHAHKHIGHAKHEHAHKGHGHFSHDHEGHGDHKHKHFGDGSHSHKHVGKAHHSHSHDGHSDNKHSHLQEAHFDNTHIPVHEAYSEDINSDFEFEPNTDDAFDHHSLIEKSKSHKTKGSTINSEEEFDELVASLRSYLQKQKQNTPKPSQPHNLDFFIKQQRPSNNFPSHSVKPLDISFKNANLNNLQTKDKETTSFQPFSEDYLAFLEKYSPSKNYGSELKPRYSFSGRDIKKTSDYEVSEKVKDVSTRGSDKTTEEDIEEHHADIASSVEDGNTPNLVQYNVVHGKKSDIFPSMSYVSQIRGSR